jgi:hypothetical protein
VAQELILSFVPDAEQHFSRTVLRRKYQLTCDRVRLQNPLESLLEEAHLKLSPLRGIRFERAGIRTDSLFTPVRASPPSIPLLSAMRS